MIYCFLGFKAAYLAACFCWLFSWLTLTPWRWRRYVSSERRTVSEIHGVPTQKTVLFIGTAVRTQNPTCTTIFLYIACSHFSSVVASVNTFEMLATHPPHQRNQDSRWHWNPAQVHPAPLKAWNLLWLCCFITSRQWVPLFRCLVLTGVLGVAATLIGVSCEVRT
jgi:hypothetical protein